MTRTAVAADAALLETLRAVLPSGSRARYVLAFSGGLDSTVLLHLAQRLGLGLRAVHIQHDLQSAAPDWARHCQRLCRRLEVPCEIRPVQVKGIRELGLEAAARAARYSALMQALLPGEILLLAQHENDQAETVLLQLMRGAGPRGLAAMPPAMKQEGHWLLRPLLDVGRPVLADYARRHRLRWIEDPSNVDTRLRRNRLRHGVLQQWEQAWPGTISALARSARLQAESATLLDTLAELDTRNCAGAVPAVLDIGRLRELEDARRRNLLRYWLERQGLPLPSATLLERVADEILAAKMDTNPCLSWPGGELRRYRLDLWAMPTQPLIDPGWQSPWTGRGPRLLPDGSRLHRLMTQSADKKPPGGLVLPPRARLQLRYPQGGERLRPHKGRPSRSLKQLCQEAGIPPWVRLRLPLLYCDDQLIAVADRWVAADWQSPPGWPGQHLHWENPPPGYPPVANMSADTT